MCVIGHVTRLHSIHCEVENLATTAAMSFAAHALVELVMQ